MPSRRNFIKTTSAFAGGILLEGPAKSIYIQKLPVYAHLWVYASRYPPDWDCTPILDEVFSDLRYAGMDGVEIMEILLRNNDAVSRFNELIQKYDLPVTGTSYYGDMWDKDKQQEILDDLELVTERLHTIGGTMIGLTVGDAGRTKTEAELDAQAELLKKILLICAKNRIEPNIHNHTFEAINDLYDLKGIMERIPEIKLGPDLNWLVRAGVDPVWFIKAYSDKIVYMHIRDQDAGGKWTEAVGEGVTNFPVIAKALKEINYSGKVAIELAFDKPPVRAVKEDWKLSREYVRKVFGW